MSIGGHQSSAMGKDEWLTPPHILVELGEFDLDPCSPINRPWDTAKHHYTAMDNGLAHPWDGRVWVNPPYGLETAKWLDRLAQHGNGIALIFARTETRMFFDHVWRRVRAAANAGAPSCLIGYGGENVRALVRSKLGAVCFLRPQELSA